MRKILFTMMICIGLAGCFSSSTPVNIIPEPPKVYKVSSWSGGKEVKSWLGQDLGPTWQHASFYFTDRATGKKVYVSGNVSIEQQ